MLCQIIEEIINYHGYTIKRIARETGLSVKTIQLIKAGKNVKTRSKTTHKLFSLYFTLQYRKSLRHDVLLSYFYLSPKNNYYIEDVSKKSYYNLSDIINKNPIANLINLI